MHVSVECFSIITGFIVSPDDPGVPVVLHGCQFLRLLQYITWCDSYQYQQHCFSLNMVRHTALFYSEESLLEYLNGETKSMVEELAAMQDHGVAYVIRRDNEISEDTETLFRNMHPSLHFKFMDIIAGFTKNKVVDMNGSLEANDDGTVSLNQASVPCAVDGTVRSNHFDNPQGALGMFIVKNVANVEEKTSYLGFLGEILENYMEMPVQLSWIIAEDDEDELTMYEVFMFNTVENEGLHVHKNFNLPGWQPAATGNRPSLVIAGDMHMHLAEKNTSVLESLTRGRTVTPYLDGFMMGVMSDVGDGDDTWLDFTSFVAGFNANEWVLFNP